MNKTQQTNEALLRKAATETIKVIVLFSSLLAVLIIAIMY